MKPRHQSTLGLVLHRYPNTEKDTSLIILSQDLGKINCLAKNTLHPRSRRRGHLQIGNVLRLELYQLGNIYFITETKTISTFSRHPLTELQSNLLFLFAEIVNHLTPPAQADPFLFELCLRFIDSINHSNQQDFLANEIDLVSHFGYGPPSDISTLYRGNRLRLTQQHLYRYIESIISRPLQTKKLLFDQPPK